MDHRLLLGSWPDPETARQSFLKMGDGVLSDLPYGVGETLVWRGYAKDEPVRVLAAHPPVFTPPFEFTDTFETYSLRETEFNWHRTSLWEYTVCNGVQQWRSEHTTLFAFAECLTGESTRKRRPSGLERPPRLSGNAGIRPPALPTLVAP